MTPSRPLSASHVRASPAQRDRLRSVEQRLANAERELRTQFTRIAQLQAELDQLLAERRRAFGSTRCDEECAGEVAPRGIP
jgi:septal ring factor EnvC (AmiA/AmiB activator)